MAKKPVKLVREGSYLAEAEVDLLETGDAWSPYLSMEDAYRLDDIRAALHSGDLVVAASMGKVYAIMPIEN